MAAMQVGTEACLTPSHINGTFDYFDCSELRILIVKVLQAKFVSSLSWNKTSDAQQSVIAVVWLSFSWLVIHFQ